MKEGIYKELSNNAYHASEGLSSSRIKPALISTKMYKHSLNSPVKRTDDMDDGTLFHTLTLEPEKFEDSYLIKPEISKRSNAGKEAHALHEEECAEKCLISSTKDRIEAVKGMTSSVSLHPEIGAILNAKGNAEISAYAIDPDTGFLLKARADLLFEFGGKTYILDLKKCKDASFAGFRNAVQSYHYDLSAWYYIHVFRLAGIEVEGFFWAACEPREPYSCALYQADETRLQVGESKAKLALKRILDLKKEKRTIDLNNGKPCFVPASDWEIEKWCNNPEIIGDL